MHKTYSDMIRHAITTLQVVPNQDELKKPSMFQAYISSRPLSNDRVYLPYTGATVDEVRKAVKADYPQMWTRIFIAEVKEMQL
jgi:hypothetical protein